MFTARRTTANLTAVRLLSIPGTQIRPKTTASLRHQRDALLKKPSRVLIEDAFFIWLAPSVKKPIVR